MKAILILTIFSIALSSCSSNQNKEEDKNTENKSNKKFYGLKEITESGAISVDSVLILLNKNENLTEQALEDGVKVKGIKTKIEGKIVDMCQMSGCWFTFVNKDGQIFQVNMREHKETSKEWAGKTVVAEGIAYAEEISIEELRHQAKQEGASREDLSKIKNPQTNYFLLADGAIEKTK